MKYLGAKFSVAMPGGKHWPLGSRDEFAHYFDAPCPACGAVVVASARGVLPHVDGREERTTRKRICFG